MKVVKLENKRSRKKWITKSIDSDLYKSSEDNPSISPKVKESEENWDLLFKSYMSNSLEEVPEVESKEEIATYELLRLEPSDSYINIKQYNLYDDHLTAERYKFKKNSSKRFQTSRRCEKN